LSEYTNGLYFIETIFEFSSSAVEINNVDIEFDEINDNLSSSINQPDNFQNFNNLLKYNLDWQFNEIATQKLLNEINDEINAQQEFLDL
jgi:hypothetical protein